MTLKYRILVVDDDADIRYMLKQLLEHNNYKVCMADNGIAAEALVLEERYDAAIIDLRMPVIDGIETLRRLKSINPDLPVMMMSANASKPDRKKAHELGAVAFYDKPFDFNAILNKLTQYLKDH